MPLNEPLALVLMLDGEVDMTVEPSFKVILEFGAKYIPLNATVAPAESCAGEMVTSGVLVVLILNTVKEVCAVPIA